CTSFTRPLIQAGQVLRVCLVSLGVARCDALSQDRNVHRASLLRQSCHGPATAQHFVIGMGGDDEDLLMHGHASSPASSPISRSQIPCECGSAAAASVRTPSASQVRRRLCCASSSSPSPGPSNAPG